ncbi:MAG: glycosyltransferase family 4 protein [Magnetococcales bacterium]|nr:glycosyltransferase family 4 protein [Magnetococcales bacterium]
MSDSPSLSILHTESSCGWGGQEIRLLDEAAGMIARGHRVQLLAPAEARIVAAAPRYGVPVTPLPIGRKNLRGLWAVWNWLRVNPVSVVVTHSSTDSWLLAVAARLLRRAPPLVRLRHISSPVPANLPTRWLYGRAARHVVTTAEKIRQDLLRGQGLSPERVTSVPTGLDLKRFSPGDRAVARQGLGLDPGEFLIGIVATLRSWKGHRHLIEAFKLLPEGAARLVVVGDGPQRENLRRQVTGAGLGDRVLLAGHQDDVLPWLTALDLFVLPSYAHEGVPQALMQAMACGLAVISTPVGGIAETVTDGDNGLLVPPQDPPALAQAMAKLLTAGDTRRRLGLAARAHAERHFSRESMLTRMESILREAAGLGPTGAGR